MSSEDRSPGVFLRLLRLVLPTVVLGAMVIGVVGAQVCCNQQWLIYHKPSFHGRVIDQETKEPIEGAIVVVDYTKHTSVILMDNVRTINVREAVTNKKGEFEIPSYVTLIGPLSRADLAVLQVFKGGYGGIGSGGVPWLMSAPERERYFSSASGVESEFKVGPSGAQFETRRAVGGIIELKRLKTLEERRLLGMMGPVGDDRFYHKQPRLIEALREEWSYLTGQDPGNLYR